MLQTRAEVLKADGANIIDRGAVNDSTWVQQVPVSNRTKSAPKPPMTPAGYSWARAGSVSVEGL